MPTTDLTSRASRKTPFRLGIMLTIILNTHQSYKTMFPVTLLANALQVPTVGAERATPRRSATQRAGTMRLLTLSDAANEVIRLGPGEASPLWCDKGSAGVAAHVERRGADLPELIGRQQAYAGAFGAKSRSSLKLPRFGR